MSDYTTWQVENDAYLSAALAWLRARLERFAGSGSDDGASGAEPKAAAEMRALAAADPALAWLRRQFGLTSFESNVLLLCAALELDTRVAALCAAAQRDSNRPYPTFALALALFDDPAWDALSPGRPLRYWYLIEVNHAASQSLTSSPLRADERIVSYIKGLNYLDDRLATFLTPLPSAAGEPHPPPSQGRSVQTIVDRFAAAESAGRSIHSIQLVGADPLSRLLVARHASAALGLDLYRLPAALLPVGGADLERFLRLWERESGLLPMALYLDARDLDPDAPQSEPFSAAEQLMARNKGLLYLATRDTWSRTEVPGLVLDVSKPTPAEQRSAWRVLLGERAGGSPALLAGQFDLNVPVIQRVVREVLLEESLGQASQTEEAGSDAPVPSLHDRLWYACRAQTRPQLEKLAQRLVLKAHWRDIVLPDVQTDLLHQITAQVRRRSQVYDRWRFRDKMNRGFGISVLFAGNSGTGKTMAAEVIANDLQLDLYRIDLSGVVSKYIGETEKNLRRLFDAAEDGGAILFFDEADALFGKRSEVKDSHDRYANIEINYLLQRMEVYRGLAILATNMKSALDDAFLRRLRFIVDFPFPGQDQRLQIWERAFPWQVPGTDALDYAWLARFSLTGGSIHNIALNATFSAAQAGTTVTMPLVLAAIETELRKLEVPINKNQFRWPGGAA